MVFNSSFADPDLTKDARGAPVVSHGPARVSPYDLGVIAGRNPQAAAAQAGHPAPGEELRVVVPAVTKADRHPDTGRYVRADQLAAGYPGRAGSGPVDRVLDSQPRPLSGRGGPFAAQFSDPMVRPPTDHGDGRPHVGFQQLPLDVQVSQLDLRGPAGSLPGIVAVPDPSPVSRPSPCPDPQSNPDRPVVRGAGPLESALTAHNGRTTLFGISTGQAVSEVPS